MSAFLTILACFAGVFAFAFGISGFIGLVSFEPQSKKGGIFLCLLDSLVTGGAIAMFRGIARNWSGRVTERKLLYAGLACGVVCAALVWLIRRMQ